MPNPFVEQWSVGGILSHFVLIQNFSRPWSVAVDSPMWSVAAEAQIYVLMPLILLPVWRRFGMVASVLTGLLIGMIPVFLLPRGTDFDSSSPWFVGIFALGMAGAVCTVSPREKSIFSRHRFWAVAAASLLGAILLLQLGLPRVWSGLGLWSKDVLNACCIVAFLVFLARSQLEGTSRAAFISRLLSSKALVLLGGFSYSLYLLHHPIISLVDLLLPAHLSPHAHVVALLVLGMAASLLIAYFFSLAFEHNTLLGKGVDALAAKTRRWIDAGRARRLAHRGPGPTSKPGIALNQ